MTPSQIRKHERISLRTGMTVAWYCGGDSQVSRVKTLGSGGLFLSSEHVRPVGTKLTPLFEVPGGFVQAEAVVRNVSPSEGMGVEFTNAREPKKERRAGKPAVAQALWPAISS